MRKLFLSTIALAAIAVTPALSADLSRPVVKAPPVAPPVYSWTGCYLGAGGGYGMWNQDTVTLDDSIPVSSRERSGGRGWFGTVGGGCDYQIAQRWVIGAFADYDFASIKGDFVLPLTTLIGSEKERSAWAVGGRIGYVVTPALLAYVSGGFTEARFSSVSLFAPTIHPVSSGLTVPAHTFSGWFIGSGYEYNLGWLPGLFWKTEYRFADYGSDVVPIFDRGRLTDLSVDTRKTVQTIRSELVWRFNWGGPLRAAY